MNGEDSPNTDTEQASKTDSKTPTSVTDCQHRFRQAWACVFASNGALINGLSIGWTVQYGQRLMNGELGFKITQEQFSWVASLLPAGAAIGSILACPLVYLLGRRLTILLMFIPFIIGWPLMVFSKNIQTLYASRILLGVCAGAQAVAVPMYIGEIVEAKNRGKMACIFGLFFAIGICLPYLTQRYIKSLNGSVPLFIIPMTIYAAFAYMPESPVYLACIGEGAKAVKVIRWFYGEKCDATVMLRELGYKGYKKLSYQVIQREMQDRYVRYTIMLAVGLVMLQQFSGIKTVVFNSSGRIAQDLEGVEAIDIAALMGLLQILGAAGAMLILDAWGRRKLLILTSFAMIIMGIFLGMYFDTGGWLAKVAPKWLPIIIFCFYVTAYSLGSGPIAFILITEIFTPISKGIIMSMHSFLNSVLTFILVKTFLRLQKFLGIGQLYWIFTAVMCVSVLLVWFFIIETKGLTLRQIIEHIVH